jgi:hypothetical protein
MNKALTGLSGEYYVLAQLTHRNMVAALTLSNTKSVDILVTNPELNKLYKVEVKTTLKGPYRERLFGNKPFYAWPMNKKHEQIAEKKLFYCFVVLQDTKKLPKFFMVPSKDVAMYVKKQHEHWLSTRKSPVNETAMRKFRISVDDPNGYENNWGVFLK